MYRNLLAEMSRKGITRKEIAGIISCNYTTIREKINGKRDFTVEEASLIRDTYFQECTLDYLFEKEKKAG